MRCLTDKVRGIRAGEITFFSAGRNVGKSRLEEIAMCGKKEDETRLDLRGETTDEVIYAARRARREWSKVTELVLSPLQVKHLVDKGQYEERERAVKVNPKPYIHILYGQDGAYQRPPVDAEHVEKGVLKVTMVGGLKVKYDILRTFKPRAFDEAGYLRDSRRGICVERFLYNIKPDQVASRYEKPVKWKWVETSSTLSFHEGTFEAGAVTIERSNVLDHEVVWLEDATYPRMEEQDDVSTED